MRRAFALALALCAPLGAALSPGLAAQAPPVVVASKPFGESYLLAEMMAQLLERHGVAVTRRPGLGATEVAFAALRDGAIDIYPEYTGTGLTAVLHDSLPPAMLTDRRAVYAHVARASETRWGIRWLPPLGFENSYAVAVTRATGSRLGLRTLADLGAHGQSLRAGFTADFIGRPDGLPALQRGTGWHPTEVRALAPAVKYRALETGAVDVIDGYATDGLLANEQFVILDDATHLFPPYEACVLVGARLARTRPAVVAELARLSGRLDAATMRRFNRRVEVDRESIAAVASDLLAQLGLGDPSEGGGDGPAGPAMRGMRAHLGEIPAHLARHLLLVAVALGAAILVAFPLGLALERAGPAAEPVLTALGALQTIPSLALLAALIPLLGVGVGPALVALWVYALSPIARNTYLGVRDADHAAVAAAEALGMTAAQRLLQVRLPLALPVIVSGVRTSAVLTVGAATLAAFVGAGGLGEPIATGLALADGGLILAGAIPAAALALLVDGGLALVERAVQPPHRRARR